MQKLMTMNSSILSFIILAAIYYNAYNRFNRVFTSYKLYIALLQTNMALIVIDILGWVFNGLPGTHNWLANTVFNLLLYLAAPISALLWILYTDYQVYHDEGRIAKAKRYLWAIFLLNAVLTVASLYTGWFFWVDANNIYHRGNYFFVHLIICYSLFVYPIFFVSKNRDKIEKKYYYTLLLFFVPPVIGTVIQAFNYGVSFNWVGMTISLLIIYFNIQNKNLNTDYLTGVYNRLHIDDYLQQKIRNLSEGRTFSLILVDLNDFKHINDQFGHAVGDEALKDAVGILRSCVRQNDFVARYGGDEFIVLLDIDDRSMLEQAVERIHRAVDKFNGQNHRPYTLSFCLGYDLYDNLSNTDADSFIRHIDALMYDNKKKRLQP